MKSRECRTNRRTFLGGVAGMAFAGGFAGAADAQAGDTRFPFVLPWDDSSATVVDVSDLNTGPAGENGFIIVRNGHFAEEKTGKRVRFLGVVFTFRAVFPSHDDAEKIAARLKKFGVNLVRIHYIDHHDTGQNTIWDREKKDYRSFDAGQVDRMDYLIAQFKKNGIYVDINLKVARRFGPEDGVPAEVAALTPKMTKRYDNFDRKMIDLQKEYARLLLTHVNPYTKNAYTEEPAVLCVEINNENSLVGDPNWPKGVGLVDLPEPLETGLRARWNGWLRANYGDTASLTRAWAGVAGGPDAVEMLRPTTAPASWRVEKSSGGSLTITPEGERLRVDVPGADGTSFHAQIHQTGFSLKQGALYTLRFRARAATPRTVDVSVVLDMSDWHDVGVRETIALTTDEKTFEIPFEARAVTTDKLRVTFAFGKETGTVWLADVSLKSGAPSLRPAAGQTLEAGTIALPAAPVRRQRNDWFAFLHDVEMKYVREMRDFLKQDLKLRSLVICSQARYGGLSGLYREMETDFIDNHAYWDHPNTQTATIRNVPMVPALETGGTFAGLAMSRVFGRPYTISEYNHPAPNDYRAECVPLLALYAARQDWDGVLLHEYGWFGADLKAWDGKPETNDRISGAFAVGGDPAKWTFLPTAARIFRAGAVPPAQALVVKTFPPALTAETFTRDLTVDTFWRGTTLRPEGAQYGLAPVGTMPVRDSLPGPDAERIRIETRDPAAARIIADYPQTAIIAGYIAGSRIIVGAAELTFHSLPAGFGVVTLQAMDGKPLALSTRILLTVVGRVENAGMQRSPDRLKTITWGAGPTLADGPEIEIALRRDRPVKVFALDGTGKPGKPVPAEAGTGAVRFTVGPEYRTLWYGIEG